jgi:two-component system alkaline phosphatase synthesis response regulator PhoP
MAANRKTVLIVDDDEMVLQLLERDLRQAGFVVVKAGNGKAALEIVSRDAVDIIVSDISMPEMDGLAFCEQLRQRPDCADIPFIFLTVHGGEQAKIRGLRSGADDYLVKPVNTGDLIARA